MEIPGITQGVWREGHESHLNRLQDSPTLSCPDGSFPAPAAAARVWRGSVPGSPLRAHQRRRDNLASTGRVRTRVPVCVSGSEGGGRTLLPAASTPRRALLGKIHLLGLHVGPEDSDHCAAVLKSQRGIVNHAETVTWGVMKIYCVPRRSLAKE